MYRTLRITNPDFTLKTVRTFEVVWEDDEKRVHVYYDGPESQLDELRNNVPCAGFKIIRSDGYSDWDAGEAMFLGRFSRQGDAVFAVE